MPYLHYRRFQPVAALRPWVEGYWSIRTTGNVGDTIEQKLYPDGGCTLMFDRHEGWEPVLQLSAKTQLEQFGAAVERIGVRLEPGGLFQIFGLSPVEFGEGSVALKLLWSGGGSEALSDALAGAQVEARIELVERWLFVQAARVQPRAGRVQRLLPLLTASAQEVSALIRDQGLSRRTLERHFRKEVGLTPGQVSHFHQLKRARTLLAQSPLSISEVALACGFFDQAHFTHQFRGFTGETPAAYRRRKLAQIYNH